MDECFGKEYKLCSKKLMADLFEEKCSVKSFPFVVHYAVLPLPEQVPFQVTVSAPKRIFRKAHERNRIKRIMREAIRKNKLNLSAFLDANGKQVALFMIYTAREEVPFVQLQKKVNNVFNQIIHELSETSEKEQLR